MTLALINAAASVATFIVFAASVGAAIVQLGHMRAGNELAAVAAIEQDFHSTQIQSALIYVQHDLPARLADPAYRAALSRPGYVDPQSHPEMVLCNWFNRSGALVRGGFLNEELFLPAFGRLVEYYWEQLGPVIALLRRTRGSGQYRSFEILAARARRRRLRSVRRDTYPRNGRRLPVTDAFPPGVGTAPND